MKKLLILLLLCTSTFAADGPFYQHKEPEIQNEFIKVYNDIKVAPNATWKAYTPDVNSFGTVSGKSFYWRQEGSDQVHVRGTFKAGVLAGTVASITIPFGSFNFSKMPFSTSRTTMIGTIKCIRTANFAPEAIIFVSDDGTPNAVNIAKNGTAGDVLIYGVGNDLGESGDYFMVDFSYAI